MEAKRLDYFKNRLLKEKDDILETISLMDKNGDLDSNTEISSEISFYDNHPADLGDELADIDKNRAIKSNEDVLIQKIDDAIRAVETNNYGKCKMCGNDISEERLEFIPYADCCIDCQKELNEKKPKGQKNRPVEEKLIGKSFINNNSGKIRFDEEDTYQIVDKFNTTPHSIDYYDNDEDEEEGYVEPIEKISNDQYRQQLPD